MKIEKKCKNCKYCQGETLMSVKPKFDYANFKNYKMLDVIRC